MEKIIQILAEKVSDGDSVAIETALKMAKMAVTVRRHNYIKVAENKILICSDRHDNVKIYAHYAAGDLTLRFIEQRSLGYDALIVLHPDGGAEYTLDQIPF